MIPDFPLSFHADAHSSEESVTSKSCMALKYEKKSTATSMSSSTIIIDVDVGNDSNV